MKHLFFLLISLLPASLIATAQTSPPPATTAPAALTGSVADSLTGQPVAFATVALLTPAGTLVTGTTTDANGAFSVARVAAGIYRLVVSFVGYRPKTVGPVSIPANGPVVDAGRVRLAADTQTLAQVNVVAQKALVEDKGDRLVYNAEIDISNAGGTAADVLRKVPMLSVDLDGNVKMRGSSNIKVLVNGKPSGIMARNLADALKQMPANIIKSVEVITSPGARYDAEGSAGVINIITKKAVKGVNGTANSTAGNLNRSLGLTLNARGKKLGLATSLNTYQFRRISDITTTRTALDALGQPASELFQRSTLDNVGTGGYGELSLDYDPDSTNRITVSVDAWGGSFPQNSQLYTRQTDPAGHTTQAFDRDIRYRNPYGNTEFNLGWTKTFTRAGNPVSGHELSFLSQFSRMPDNYYYTITQTNTGSTIPTYLERSTNLSRNKEYTLQVDYARPFTLKGRRDTATLKIDIGAKTIKRAIGSEYVIESAGTGQETGYAIDPGRSSRFTYNQQVTAGYLSLKLETTKKWNLTLGSRLERTAIRGDFPTTQTTFDNGYNNLIPSLTLAKTVHESHTFKASYTQRISRPLVWYLNPFRNYSDAKNVTTGNPYLSPELTHATEFSYSTFGKNGASLNTALYWRQTNNSIEFLTAVDSAGVALSTFQNIGRNASYGLNLNGVLQPTKALNVSLGLDVLYVSLTSVALRQRNTGWVGNLNTNISYKLPRDVSIQANGQVSSGGVNLQGNNTGFYFYGVSAKREFWGKNASLTLSVNNPFNRSVQITSHMAAPTFQSQTIINSVNRSARLTFSYTFGRMSAGDSKQSKKVSNDDSKGNR